MNVEVDASFLARACKMLSLPLRVRIMLEVHAHSVMSHSDLCMALNKPLGIWPHLQDMVAAGLLVRNTDAEDRYVTYSTNDASLTLLAQAILNLRGETHET